MLRLERWFFSSRSQSCMCFRRSALSHLCLPSFRSGVGRCFSLVMVFARSKALRTGPSFCRNGPFHRFLRPATRNLSPADTYPLYQERTSVRRPGRVFCCEQKLKPLPVRPNPPFGGRNVVEMLPPAKTPFHRTGRHFCSLSNSLWQPMCHRTRISIPPCQSGAKKVSLWQAILHRMHSTPSALPK